MNQSYRSTVRSQLLALERVRRFASRGVTITPRQIEAATIRIRRNLGLIPTILEPEKPFTAKPARVTDTLPARIERLRSAALDAYQAGPGRMVDSEAHQ